MQNKYANTCTVQIKIVSLEYINSSKISKMKNIKQIEEQKQLDGWKKFELKRLIFDLLPDTSGVNNFARGMIYHSWHTMSIKDIAIKISAHFPHKETLVKSIMRKRKIPSTN